MSELLQRRRLWLLVPDAAGTSVLVDPDGRLPHWSIDLADGETTATAATRDVLGRWGVALPIVELLFDTSAPPAPGTEVDTLVELAPPPAGWEPPTPLAWVPPEPAPATVPGLAPRVEALLAERRGDRAMDPRRSRWSRPGWHDRACAWIDRTLADAGWGPATSVVQVRHWGISALMRVTAGERVAWFKAVFPGFHQEPGITDHLHRTRPGVVAPVLGIDPDEGWLLLADVGSTFASSDLTTFGPAVDRLVAVQRAEVGRTDELLAAGCARRPLAEVAAALEAAFADPEARSWLTLDDERAAELVTWVAAAALDVDALGLPETLVHGDFHPGNVALTDAGPVIIDWSDAAITNPLVDVLTWIDWTRDDPALTEQVWDRFASGWAGVLHPSAFRDLRPRFTGVAAAYHAVSYAGIVTGVEPSHAYEHADGLAGYVALLDEAARTS